MQVRTERLSEYGRWGNFKKKKKVAGKANVGKSVRAGMRRKIRDGD